MTKEEFENVFKDELQLVMKVLVKKRARLRHSVGVARRRDRARKPLAREDVAYLADFSQIQKGVDLACRFVYDENGVEIVNFGKYKGQAVKNVLKKDPNYKVWMMQGDFTMNTKQTLERLALKYAGK